MMNKKLPTCSIYLGSGEFAGCLDDVCSGISMHERKYVHGRTAHVRYCAYIQWHDMPNILFLVLIYGNIPFKVLVSLIARSPKQNLC